MGIRKGAKTTLVVLTTHLAKRSSDGSTWIQLVGDDDPPWEHLEEPIFNGSLVNCTKSIHDLLMGGFPKGLSSTGTTMYYVTLSN